MREVLLLARPAHWPAALIEDVNALRVLNAIGAAWSDRTFRPEMTVSELFALFGVDVTRPQPQETNDPTKPAISQ